MLWQIKKDMIGRGWFIVAQATYYLYVDGTTDTWAKDNYSCFWNSVAEAVAFFRAWTGKEPDARLSMVHQIGGDLFFTELRPY